MPFTLQQVLDPTVAAAKEWLKIDPDILAHAELTRQGSVMGAPKSNNVLDLISPLDIGPRTALNAVISGASDRALVSLLKRMPRLQTALEAVPQQIRLLLGGPKDPRTGQRQFIESIFGGRPGRHGAQGQLDMPATVGSYAERERLKRTLPQDVAINPTLIGEGAARVNPSWRLGAVEDVLAHEGGHAVMAARQTSPGTKKALANRLANLMPEESFAGLFDNPNYPPEVIPDEIISRALGTVYQALAHPARQRSQNLMPLIQEVNRSVLPVLEGRAPRLGR